jgi:PAS domain S-box-containing protein
LITRNSLTLDTPAPTTEDSHFSVAVEASRLTDRDAPYLRSMDLNVLEVRHALEQDEVVACFQPIFELHTGRLSGFEVLARWQSPIHGLVLPEGFITLAEKNGLIGQLMKQVLGKAFSIAPQLPEPLSLAINVSPTQLRERDLADQISRAATAAGFPLRRLTVEITETGLLDNLNQAKATATELKALGCRLALDDFGTGYSSLAHLQALPFDELKIDRSFVSLMTNKRESRKIVAAIIGLGHSLGLKTVGEGVETEQQADMLLWLGCDMGQGWLYGKAVPPEQLPALIADAPRPISAGLSTPGDGWAVSNLEALPTQRLAQLQAIYDGAPVGLCFLDRNFRYVSINRRLAEMNGASVAAHLGRTVQDMIPDSFPTLEPYLLRALRGEAVREVEVARPSNIEGNADWTAMLSYQPALDEADEVIGISVAVADVTVRKRAEDSLRESDDRQTQLSGDDVVPWIMDAEGNSLQPSSQWVRSTTHHEDHIRDLGWLEALHTDDLQTTMKTMKAALRTGKPIDIEYRVKDIDGEWRWMRSRGSPRFGPSGEITRWYGSVEDIDQRKQTEQQLK